MKVRHTKQAVTFPDYLGCVQINSSPLFSFTGIAHNSLTQCSQLCIGTEVAIYAAVSPTDCQCFGELPNVTPVTSECNSTCNSVPNQMCGGISGTNSVFNLLKIGNNFYLPGRKCEHLLVRMYEALNLPYCYCQNLRKSKAHLIIFEN